MEPEAEPESKVGKHRFRRSRFKNSHGNRVDHRNCYENSQPKRGNIDSSNDIPPNLSRAPPAPPIAAAALNSGWTHANADSDLEVDASSDGEYNLRVFLDLHESDDEEGIGFKDAMAALNDEYNLFWHHGQLEIGWGRLLPFEEAIICEDEEAYYEGPALERNANLSSWWRHVRGTAQERENQDDHVRGTAQEREDQDEQGEGEIVFTFCDDDGFTYEYVNFESGSWRVMYYEWPQQQRIAFERDGDVRMLSSAACTWYSTSMF